MNKKLSEDYIKENNIKACEWKLTQVKPEIKYTLLYFIIIIGVFQLYNQFIILTIEHAINETTPDGLTSLCWLIYWVLSLVLGFVVFSSIEIPIPLKEYDVPKADWMYHFPEDSHCYKMQQRCRGD